ncbi:MAG: hypothetical protein HYR88_08375 [Verrucomicrobia bacterium]|nr:hypothetical protein [Verrucomicrobiota bacterium]MBI3870060.1 hypothetical protein [Verrucomicrobiota bacterium]
MRTRTKSRPSTALHAARTTTAPGVLRAASLLCLILLSALLPATAAPVSGVRIKKVLPHYLDKQGKHTLSPSLLERDAYQAELRASPARRGGLQFDVLVGALPPGAELKLKLEARGSHDTSPTAVTLERTLVKQDRFHRWLKLTLTESDYTKLGNLVAWRVSLWQGDTMAAEQKSFLW